MKNDKILMSNKILMDDNLMKLHDILEKKQAGNKVPLGNASREAGKIENKSM